MSSPSAQSTGRYAGHRYSLQEQDLAHSRPSLSPTRHGSDSGYSIGASSPTDGSKAFLSASQRLKPSRKSSFAEQVASTSVSQSSIFSLSASSARRMSNSSAVADFAASQTNRRTSGSSQTGAVREGSLLSFAENSTRSRSSSIFGRSQSADASSRRNSTRRGSVGSGFDLNSLFTSDEIIAEELKGLTSSPPRSSLTSGLAGNSSALRRFSTASSQQALAKKFYPFLTDSRSKPQTSMSEVHASPIAIQRANQAEPSQSSSHINKNNYTNKSNNTGDENGKNLEFRDFIADLHSRQGGVWEPPLSCQRRLSHLKPGNGTSQGNAGAQFGIQMDCQPDNRITRRHYFPLELTNRDYVTRLFAVIRFAILETYRVLNSHTPLNSHMSHMAYSPINVNNNANGSLSAGRSTEFIQDLLRILFNKSDSLEIEKVWSLIVDSSFFPKQRMAVEILTFHYFNITHNTDLDYGPLINLVDVISACKEFITCISVRYINVVEIVLREIQDIDSMVKIHSTFKQQRMESLGWRWPVLAESLALDSSVKPQSLDSQPLTSNQLNTFSAQDIGTGVLDPKLFITGEVKPNADRLKSQLEELLSPSSKAKILLVNRLMCVSKDLASISTLCEKKQNFHEARRIFQIMEKANSTFDCDDGAALLDRVKELCVQTKQFVTSVENDIIGMRIAIDLSEVIVMRNLNAELSKLNFMLHSLLNRFSIVEDLLKNPQLLIEATNHITSLFLLEYEYSDGETIGGLIIKSKSQLLLESIWEWPNIVEEINTRRASYQSRLVDVNSGEEVDIIHCLSVNIADIYDESEHNYEQSVYRDADQLINDDAHANNDGKSASGNGSNSLGTINKRLRFQKTIDAAASTLTILTHLSSETGDAHTRMIVMLLGMSSDVRKLAESLRDSVNGSNSSRINDQLTSEANRLALLAETVDNTVDVDTAEPLAVCGGRSRLRIDVLSQVLSRSEIFLEQLKIAVSTAEQGNDFKTSSTLRRYFEGISGYYNRIVDSCKPFNLLESIPNSRDIVSTRTTDFINGTYLFNLICTENYQNIASLAVISSCSEVLSDIYKNWSTDQLASGFWLSRNADGASNRGSIDFSIPRVLRRIGFSMEVLKSAGFSDVDVLLAGYPIELLRSYPFDNVSLDSMKESGISDAVIRAIGQYSSLQNKLLILLFTSLGGRNWNDSKGWADLAIQTIDNGKFGVDNSHRIQPFGATMAPNGYINKLILNSNNLVGYIPDCFHALASITQLCLGGNKLVGEIPPSLYCLTNLTVLQLNNNGLYGSISNSIKSLHQLSILRLENNRFSGPLPAAITELTKLKKFIANNNAFTGTIYQLDFSGLKQIQEFYINNNMLSGSLPESLGHITSLYSLNLQNNKFSGVLPSTFSNLQKLSNLNLSGNMLLPIDQLKLQKVLPQCHIVLKDS